MRSRAWFWLATLPLLLACSLLTGTQPPTAPPATFAPEAPTAPAIAPPSPDQPSGPVEVPERPLADRPPWLLFASADGVELANPDGSGSTILVDSTRFRGAASQTADDLSASLSPDGEWLALVTFDDPDAGAGPSLDLVHLPDGETESLTRLLSPELEDEIRRNAPVLTDAGEAYTGATMSGGRRWSPDGRYLAFVAATDGPSSDLYLYDVGSGGLNRLTSGPNQTASLTWSPDSRWIVHQEVRTFGTGAGWSLVAVWAAEAPRGAVKKLYVPQGSVEEAFLGWIDSDTLVVYSQNLDGAHTLRHVSLRSGQITPRVDGFFDRAALDPSTGALAFTVSGFTASFSDRDQGLHLASGSGGPRFVAPGDFDSVTWRADAGRFFATGVSGVVGVTPEGDVQSMLDLGPGVASPGGGAIASVCPGTEWVDSQTGLRTSVAASDASVVLWRPDSTGFFFQASDDFGLYFADEAGRLFGVDDRAEPLGWAGAGERAVRPYPFSCPG